MTHTIGEIAEATGLAAEGDLSIAVEGPAEPGAAGPEHLAMAMSRAYAGALEGSAARAAVLWDGADWRELGLEAALYAPRARVAIAEINDVFDPVLALDPGVHPTAVIADTAVLAEDCWIGPLTVIGPGARIGRGARILGQATIGAEAVIGDDARIHAGVRIGARVLIGDRFIAQPNAVIGADGFSFVTPEAGSVESAKATGKVSEGQNALLRRINSLGAVQIGDDVEIGGCSAIDRGTVADTTIGSGTKIDNLVQIGHNVKIGESCLLCGHVGIAGSCEIGDRVVLGGKVGVADHVKIGHDAVLAGGTLVPSNVKPKSVMMGIPAAPREEMARQFVAVKRLPKALEQLKEVRQKLGL